MIKSVGIATVTLFLSLMLGSFTAQAATYSTSNVNMRAGPGVNYARIGVIPAGRRVHVQNCTRGGRWCRVSFRRHGGWVSSGYLTNRARSFRRPAVVYRPQVRRRHIRRSNRRGFQLYIGQRPAFRRTFRRPPPPFYVYFGR